MTFEKTFESAALDYEKSRPAYCGEIYADIFRYKPTGPKSHVLDRGGHGKGVASDP